MSTIYKQKLRVVAGIMAVVMMFFSVTDYAMAADFEVTTDYEVTADSSIATTSSNDPGVQKDTISYVLNGGILPEDAPTKYIPGKEMSLPTPTRDGYKFTGWFSDKEKTHKIEKITKDTTGKVKLYAGWKAYKYSVTFVSGADDTTGKMESQTFTYNKSTSLRKCKFKRANYSFAYWSVSGNSSERYLNNEKTKNIITPKEDNENVVLVANWQPTDDKAVYYVKYFNVTDSKAPVEFTQRERGKYGVKDVYNAFTKLELPQKSKMKRTGYTFEGWYSDENCRNKFKITKKTNMCVKAYAKWTSWNYNVVFCKNGGKGSMPSQVVKYGENVNITKNTLSKNGCEFAGWALSKGMANKGIVYIKDEGSVKGYIEDSVFKNKQKVKLYPVWNSNEFPINYVNSVGKIESALDSYATGDTFSFKNLKDKTTFSNLPQFVRASNFAGWYTSSTYTKKATITKKTKGTLNLYSKWKFGYEVTFDKGAEDASGIMTSKKLDYSKAKGLPKNAFSRKGYRFEGWAVVSANGYSMKTGVSSNALTKEDIVFGEKEKLGNFDVDYFSGEGNSAVLRLVAVWGKGACVTFDTNNGRFADSIVKNESLSCNGTKYIKWFDYSENVSNFELGKRFTPTREGYTFTGWYTNKECTALASINSKFSGNKVFYAGWESSKYWIRYNSNDGRNKVKKQKGFYGLDVKIKKTPFKRKGYEFVGWGVSANATEPILTNKQIVHFDNSAVSANCISVDDKIISSDCMLYAIWKPINYEAVFVDVTMKDSYVIKYTVETGLRMEDAKAIIQSNYNVDDYVINGIFKSKSLKKYAADIPAGKAGKKKPKKFYISWIDA